MTVGTLRLGRGEDEQILRSFQLTALRIYLRYLLDQSHRSQIDNFFHSKLNKKKLKKAFLTMENKYHFAVYRSLKYIN